MTSHRFLYSSLISFQASSKDCKFFLGCREPIYKMYLSGSSCKFCCAPGKKHAVLTPLGVTTTFLMPNFFVTFCCTWQDGVKTTRTRLARMGRNNRYHVEKLLRKYSGCSRGLRSWMVNA